MIALSSISIYFHTSCTAWQQWTCCLGSLPGLPWWISVRTCVQSNFMRHVIYTCAQAFQPACTSCSSAGDLYAWGFSYTDTCGTVVNQFLPSSYSDLYGCIAIIIGQLSLRGLKYFDLSYRLLFVIFCLHGGQKVTVLFMGNGPIVLTFIVHINLHGCWKSVISCNANLIIRELSFANCPIWFIILLPLHQRCR